MCPACRAGTGLAASRAPASCRRGGGGGSGDGWMRGKGVAHEKLRVVEGCGGRDDDESSTVPTFPLIG